MTADNPRVRGSIPRLATSNTQQGAHSPEWAFCFSAFEIEAWRGTGFSKYSLLILLAVAFIAFLWRFGRTVFAGVTRWLLWALAALCACAGVLVLLESEGKPLPILSGLLLMVFAAYTIKVAESARKRS